LPLQHTRRGCLALAVLDGCAPLVLESGYNYAFLASAGREAHAISAPAPLSNRAMLFKSSIANCVDFRRVANLAKCRRIAISSDSHSFLQSCDSLQQISLERRTDRRRKPAHSREDYTIVTSRIKLFLCYLKRSGKGSDSEIAHDASAITTFPLLSQGMITNRRRD